MSVALLCSLVDVVVVVIDGGFALVMFTLFLSRQDLHTGDGLSTAGLDDAVDANGPIIVDLSVLND